MEYRTLGRTGLRVSVMGLGCGGPSRIGQRTGSSKAESIALIRQALDAGVNFIDTADLYQTEEIVGQAIKGLDRDTIVISTKKSSLEERLTPQNVAGGLEGSLKRLNLDYVDVYHLHSILRQDYDYVLTEIVPVLQKLRQQGKVRYFGITETSKAEPGHDMLQRAVEDDIWDVMMVRFNILNQSARTRVLAPARERGIGILVMFALRLALSRPERLKEVIKEAIEHGQVDPAEIDITDPLSFVLKEGGAASIPDAAYRFCRDEPGTHVILSGTGNAEHLRANLESFARPPLPAETIRRLKHIFRHVDSISGQ